MTRLEASVIESLCLMARCIDGMIRVCERYGLESSRVSREELEKWFDVASDAAREISERSVGRDGRRRR